MAADSLMFVTEFYVFCFIFFNGSLCYTFEVLLCIAIFYTLRSLTSATSN